MEIVDDTYDTNSSYAQYETTTVTITIGRVCDLDHGHGIALIVINILLATVGTFGNILIILAVLNAPRLRQKPSNFLLLSLAIADLLVTMVAQPLFVAALLLRGISQQCHNGIGMVFVIMASLAASSSVFHLAAISIDRALSALSPHKHHDIIKRGFKIMLTVCWLLSGGIVCILGLYPAGTKAVYITLLLCLGIMIVSYGLILYKILANPAIPMATSKLRRDRAMEKRVSGTVAIIIFLFAVCWIPLIAFHLSPSTTDVPETTYWWIRTLYLANSSMNFIVYSLRIKQFRAAYLKIINRNIRKLCLMLPEKWRCCVPTYDLRRDFSSTQNTPLSPTSMAPMPVPLSPRSPRSPTPLLPFSPRSPTFADMPWNIPQQKN